MSLLLLFGGGPPPAVIPVNLTTFAPNRLGATSFFDSEILEVAKNNAEALVLGATGANLTADLTVTAGHTHDGTDARLAWKQIATHVFAGIEIDFGAATVGTAPDECYDAIAVDGTTSIEIASVRLWLTATEAADVIPRVRVSNDNSATTNCTITFDFYDVSDLTTPVLTYALVLSTATARNRAWVTGVTQDLIAAGIAADADVASRYPCICLISAALASDVEDVALHEVSFGVTP